MRDRRSFIATLFGATVGLGTSLRAQTVRNIEPSDLEDSLSLENEPLGFPVEREGLSDDTVVPGEGAPIRPPALGPGSTIGLVAPASGVSSRAISKAVSILGELGFEVKVGENVGKGIRISLCLGRGPCCRVHAFC